MRTDSTAVEAPKPTEDAPLYDLLKLLIPASEWEQVDREWREGGKGYGDFKKKLLGAFHDQFDPARKRREELLGDPAELERILARGTEKARAMAAPIMDGVRRAVGLR